MMQAVEVKKEKGDDVIADIIGDGNYEQDEDMAENNANSNRNPVPVASPVSPTPLPSATGAIPPSLNIESMSPQSKQASLEPERKRENQYENQKDRGKTTAKDGANGDHKVPRMVQLSGDGHVGRSDNNSIHETSYDTIKAFVNRPDARKYTRFFVMKSYSENHLEISIEKGIWATQHHNEGKLNDAFRRCDVVLVFSVNESRHFQGYAHMTSPIGGYKTKNVWVDSKHDGVWGNTFHIKWIQRYDLPFTDTAHLHNSYNEDKPVKVCRDGQEIEKETAMALCALIDTGAAKSDKKRKPSGDTVDGVKEHDGKPHSTNNSNGHRDFNPDNKRVRADSYPQRENTASNIHHNPSFTSRRIVLPPNTRVDARMPHYDARDYLKPPHALRSSGPPAFNDRYSRSSARGPSFNDRYVPRSSADASPPPKRARSRSYSPPARGYGRMEMDRKRKDREEEGGRDFDKDRARGRDFDRDRDRARDWNREDDRRESDRHRDRRDSKKGGHSPPPDLLNMSYEDYLRTLAKYRRMPQPSWGIGLPGGLPGAAPLSESEYIHYLSILSKQVKSHDMPMPDFRGSSFPL